MLEPDKDTVEPNAWYKADRWHVNYIGRWYESGGMLHATESTSMGLDLLWQNPLGFAAADPE